MSGSDGDLADIYMCISGADNVLGILAGTVLFLGGPLQGVKIWVNSPLLQLNCMQAGDMWLLVSGGVACAAYLLWAHLKVCC